MFNSAGWNLQNIGSESNALLTEPPQLPHVILLFDTEMKTQQYKLIYKLRDFKRQKFINATSSIYARIVS